MNENEPGEKYSAKKNSKLIRYHLRYIDQNPQKKERDYNT